MQKTTFIGQKKIQKSYFGLLTSMWGKSILPSHVVGKTVNFVLIEDDKGGKVEESDQCPEIGQVC